MTSSDTLHGFLKPGGMISEIEVLAAARIRWPDGPVLAEADKGPPRDGTIKAPLRSADLFACLTDQTEVTTLGRIAPAEACCLDQAGYVVRTTGRTAKDAAGARWALVLFMDARTHAVGSGWLPASIPVRRVVFRSEPGRPTLPANVGQVASFGPVIWLAAYDDAGTITGHLVGHGPAWSLADEWARGERALLATAEARTAWAKLRDSLTAQYGHSLPG